MQERDTDVLTNELAPLVSEVAAASLTDALGRMFPHRAHLLNLVTPTPGRKLFGPAVTLSFFPIRNDLFDEARHNFARLFYEAVGDDARGKTLVLASNGHPQVSLGGGTKLSRLHNHKLAGLICDGRLRDFEELASYDFATYCIGETTRWGGDILMPFAANVPVVVNGVTVIPGDYVYADSAGAVIIPANAIKKALEGAVGIEKTDPQYIDKIKREDAQDILERGSQEE